MLQPTAETAGGNRMGPAEAEAGRRCRLIRVKEMAELREDLGGRDARAPGGLHDRVHQRDKSA